MIPIQISTDNAWRDDAGCVGVAPAVFYPEPIRGAQNLHGWQWNRARSICDRCTVRAECLEDAMRYEPRLPSRSGMRGGLRPSERDALDDL